MMLPTMIDAGSATGASASPMYLQHTESARHDPGNSEARLWVITGDRVPAVVKNDSPVAQQQQHPDGRTGCSFRRPSQKQTGVVVQWLGGTDSAGQQRLLSSRNAWETSENTHSLLPMNTT